MRHWQQRPSDDHPTDHVVVYDIETIVDTEPVDGSFPPWPQHKPVAASFLSASWTSEGYEFNLDTLTCQPGDEGQFYESVDSLLPAGVTGVTFNGRGFDNAVLRLQAMAQNRFCLSGIARQAQAGRYASAHCDLAEQFSAYGAARGGSLAELCAPLGIPVKTSVGGADVGALWRAGKVDIVSRYVEEDVLATYLLWLNWSAFRSSNEKLIALPLADLTYWLEKTAGFDHLLPFTTCRPARWARSRAPALRIAAALADAELRVSKERDERAFSSDTIF